MMLFTSAPAWWPAEEDNQALTRVMCKYRTDSPQISPWTHVPHPGPTFPMSLSIFQPSLVEENVFLHILALTVPIGVWETCPGVGICSCWGQSCQPSTPHLGTSPGLVTERCLSVSVSMPVGMACLPPVAISNVPGKNRSPQERVKLVSYFID